MTIHTAFKRGQRIRIMWKDGSPHSVGKFVDKGRHSLLVEFAGNGKPIRAQVLLSDVRSVTIDRAPIQTEE